MRMLAREMRKGRKEGRKITSAFKRAMRSEEDIGMQWLCGHSERYDKLQSMHELKFTNPMSALRVRASKDFGAMVQISSWGVLLCIK